MLYPFAVVLSFGNFWIAFPTQSNSLLFVIHPVYVAFSPCVLYVCKPWRVYNYSIIDPNFLRGLGRPKPHWKVAILVICLHSEKVFVGHEPRETPTQMKFTFPRKAANFFQATQYLKNLCFHKSSLRHPIPAYVPEPLQGCVPRPDWVDIDRGRPWLSHTWI